GNGTFAACTTTAGNGENRSDSFDDGHYGAHEATALMEAFDGGVCAVCSAGGCLRYVLVDQPSGNQTYDCQANGDGPSAQMFPGMAGEKLFAFRGGQGKSGQLAHENMFAKLYSAEKKHSHDTGKDTNYYTEYQPAEMTDFTVGAYEIFP
ncbi:hypothetical protein ADUPG1_003404, partial [Aduncisulcus paluster]